MKPKTIRPFGTRVIPYRPSEGYSGIAVDFIDTPTTSKLTISETVRVNDPTDPKTAETISESVEVVIT